MIRTYISFWILSSEIGNTGFSQVSRNKKPHVKPTNRSAGAIRRIIMNIFGNANKYTNTGFILVQLRIREVEKVDAATGHISCQHVLVMRIIDSGRGMSIEYMERKLYTPFAQEDSFSPGIGLGLSIV
jgi:signal transduction histidine kinase